MHGKDVCWVHGGATPRGLASVHTTHGRYSKDLPTRMLATYEQSLTDTDLLALRSEIALIDSRLIDLIKRVDTGEAGHWWHKLSEALDAFFEANRREDKIAASAALGTMRDIIKRGKGDYAAWNEIKSIVSQRRNLVETERKRMVEMQQMVRADKFVLFVTALASSVRKHIKDTDTLAAITRDIADIAGSGLQ